MTPLSRLLIGMITGLGAIAGAAVSISAHDRMPGDMCELTLTAIPGGTRLEARVFPRASMTGSYALKVRDRGPGGTASVDQSGDFSASGDAPVVLSEIELSTSARKLDAEFTLRAGGRTHLCPLRTGTTPL